MGVAAECDQLAAQLVIEPEPFAVRQGEMAAVGVALDAESLFDGAAHHMAQLLLVAVEIQLHAAQLLRPAQREGDVSEDLKAAPVDQLFHLLKVALAGGIPYRGIGARDPGEVVDLARGRAVAVDRADGEVQRRRVVQKAVRHVGSKGAFAQLHAHVQLDAAADGLLRLTELREHGSPVVAVLFLGRLVPAVPWQGLDVVGETQVVYTQPHRGLRHLAHGVVPVGRDGGMAMVIGDKMSVSHSLNFPKKLLRCS